jgi:hypothetical protein
MARVTKSRKSANNRPSRGRSSYSLALPESSRGMNEFMVMRTIYIKPSLDQFLKRKALQLGKSKNELIREILNREQQRLKNGDQNGTRTLEMAAG